MFIKVNVLVKNKEQETFLVKSKIVGVGFSPDLNLAYLISDTGHAFIVKESLDELKAMLDKPIETI